MQSDEPSVEGGKGAAGGAAPPIRLEYRPVPPRRTPWGRRAAWAVLGIQVFVVAFQVNEVRRYRAAANPPPPTVRDRGHRDGLTSVRFWGSIYGPPAARVVLRPLASSLAVGYLGGARES